MRFKLIKATEGQEETAVLWYRYYNLEVLNQKSIRFLYKLQLANKLKEQHKEEDVEQTYDRLNRCFHKAAKKVTGMVEGRLEWEKWWNEDIERMVREEKNVTKDGW